TGSNGQPLRKPNPSLLLKINNLLGGGWIVRIYTKIAPPALRLPPKALFKNLVGCSSKKPLCIGESLEGDSSRMRGGFFDR
ncbi:hypothetical protein P7M28_02960, partial [Vibrio parahaemolyticus]|nr:hypothetical protein [Vibrio parahaemolyticus]